MLSSSSSSASSYVEVESRFELADYYMCMDEQCPAPCRHHEVGHTDSQQNGRLGMLYMEEVMLAPAEHGCVHCRFLIAANTAVLSHPQPTSDTSNIAILWRELGISDGCLKTIPGLKIEHTVEVFKDGRSGYFLRLGFSKNGSKVCDVEYVGGICDAKPATNDFSAFKIPASPATTNFMDVSSDYSMSIIEDWLSNCVSQHDLCKQVQDGNRPHRLLRVSDDAVQLVENVNDDYVALSYTWSGAKLPLTLEGNLEQRLINPIPWSDLPLTLQNAITITRRLKLNYIWIDCICIIQGSKADWEREVVIMGSIYRQAHLVISTDAADTPASGFLERSRYLEPLEIKVNGSKYILRDADTHAESGKVASRAWCYQERILARRTLKFARRELMWECSAGCSCECGQDKNTKHDVILQSTRPGYQILDLELSPGGPETHRAADDKRTLNRRTITAYEYWLFAIERYSFRSITYTADRFPAIRALAAYVQQRNSDEYIAGFWRKDLLRSLLWHANAQVWTDQPYKTTYVAPSWSWASVTRPVRFFAHKELDGPFVAEVLDVQYKLASDDALGAISSAQVTLKGPCLDVLVRKQSEDFSFSFEHGGASTIIEPLLWHRSTTNRSLWRWTVFDAQPVQSIELQLSTATRAIVRRSEVMPEHCEGWLKILWITSNRALIIGYSQDHPGSFVRLGLARLALQNSFPAEKEIVTIH